jgi:hypothetical protein
MINYESSFLLSALNGKVDIDSATEHAIESIRAGNNETVACMMVCDNLYISYAIINSKQQKTSKKYIRKVKAKKENHHAAAKLIVDYIFELEKNGMTHNDAVKCGECMANAIFS